MKTRWTVRLGDIVSRRLITIGGVGTIISVSGVFVLLAFVAMPLFFPASTENEFSRPLSATPPGQRRVHLAVDEYRTLGWELYENGLLQTFRLDTGELLERRDLREGKHRELFAGKKITAVSTTVGAPDIALGFDDGTVGVGRISFEPEIKEKAAILEDLQRREMPADRKSELQDTLEKLPPDETAAYGKNLVQRTPIGQYRIQQVAVAIQGPLKVAESPVVLIDHVAPQRAADETGPRKDEVTFAFFAHSGEAKKPTFQVCKLVETENTFTGEVTLGTDATDLPLDSLSGATPSRLLMSPGADNVMLVWRDGQMSRFDTRVLDSVTMVEELDLLENARAELTICEPILGRQTLLIGDSRGGLQAWFRVRRADTSVGDGYEMKQVHALHQADTAPIAAGMSERERLVAVGYEDGMMRVFHVTTEQLIIERRLAADEPVTDIRIAPKSDGIVAFTSSGMWQADLDAKHPDATLKSLFFPVWYEGYEEPDTVWQSSYATSGPEKKFGLWPLIFGTIKATFYAMLFGAPLALLAAVYTAEFLHPSWRMRIKPFVEMMASLPSVVLGFLAAIWLAPRVETMVPAVLACFLTIPFCYVLGAFLWHLISHRGALVLERFRFLFLLIPLPTAIILAYSVVGPLFDSWFFNGDIMRWLDDRSFGNGIGAWMMILVPMSAIVVTILMITRVNPRLRLAAGDLSRRSFASVNLLKFVIGASATVLVALGIAALLNSAGFDPRGSYVSTYTDRNALVVGFVMGFAVIPIIYTIADDALHTVPNHLRSASLGCGATPWQTAIRVVIPTAMSGLFSALMIGLGRAVGETMIVLMAGGNTPVKDWNIFSGFRTLAGNVAFELPEAEESSTHFRTLFLAALVLFMMTFVINTAAESVRLRFRKRAYQL